METNTGTSSTTLAEENICCVVKVQGEGQQEKLYTIEGDKEVTTGTMTSSSSVVENRPPACSTDSTADSTQRWNDDSTTTLHDKLNNLTVSSSQQQQHQSSSLSSSWRANTPPPPPRLSTGASKVGSAATPASNFLNNNKVTITPNSQSSPISSSSPTLPNSSSHSSSHSSPASNQIFTKKGGGSPPISGPYYSSAHPITSSMGRSQAYELTPVTRNTSTDIQFVEHGVSKNNKNAPNNQKQQQTLTSATIISPEDEQDQLFGEHLAQPTFQLLKPIGSVTSGTGGKAGAGVLQLQPKLEPKPSGSVMTPAAFQQHQQPPAQYLHPVDFVEKRVLSVGTLDAFSLKETHDLKHHQQQQRHQKQHTTFQPQQVVDHSLDYYSEDEDDIVISNHDDYAINDSVDEGDHYFNQHSQKQIIDKNNSSEQDAVQFPSQRLYSFNSSQQYRDTTAAAATIGALSAPVMVAPVNNLPGIQHETAGLSSAAKVAELKPYQPDRDDNLHIVGTTTVPNEELDRIFIRRTYSGRRSKGVNDCGSSIHRSKTAPLESTSTGSEEFVAASAHPIQQNQFLHNPIPLDERQWSIPSLRMAHQIKNCSTSASYYTDEEGTYGDEGDDDASLSTRGSSLYLPDDIALSRGLAGGTCSFGPRGSISEPISGNINEGFVLQFDPEVSLGPNDTGKDDKDTTMSQERQQDNTKNNHTHMVIIENGLENVVHPQNPGGYDESFIACASSTGGGINDSIDGSLIGDISTADADHPTNAEMQNNAEYGHYDDVPRLKTATHTSSSEKIKRRQKRSKKHRNDAEKAKSAYEWLHSVELKSGPEANNIICEAASSKFLTGKQLTSATPPTTQQRRLEGRSDNAAAIFSSNISPAVPLNRQSSTPTVLPSNNV